MVTRLAPFLPGSNTSLSCLVLLRLTDPQHARTYTPTDHHHPHQSKMRVSFALFALVAAVIMSLSSAFMPPTPRMARQVRRESREGRRRRVLCVCVFVLALPFFVSRPANTCLYLGMCVSTH